MKRPIKSNGRRNAPEEYNAGDKVEFYVREGEHGRVYRHGYIKSVRRGWLRTRYVILVAKTDQIRICGPKQIMGRLERTAQKPSTQSNGREQ